METPTRATHIWRFGLFEVDARREEVRRAGIPVKIREQPYRILTLLLERAGEVVTREELRRALWPSDVFVDFDHSLNTAMMKLRDVLGDTADQPLYIETIPKKGYRFVAPVSGGGDGAANWTEIADALCESVADPALVVPPSAMAPVLVHPRTRLGRWLYAVLSKL
ncbi:MAG: transcriptional regulator [Acidobacteriota bacterium]